MKIFNSTAALKKKYFEKGQSDCAMLEEVQMKVGGCPHTCILAVMAKEGYGLVKEETSLSWDLQAL